MEKLKEIKEKSVVLFFVLVGFLLGGAIGIIYYDKLFEVYLSKLKSYVIEDFKKTEAFANKVVDQAIKLRKMLSDNKIKYDNSIFEKVIDTRSRLIGADSIQEKVEYLTKFEDDFNKIMEFYNSRMDLRNKRFGYIEWGMTTQDYVKEYAYNKDKYRDDVKEYNEKLKKFPLTLVSKRKNFTSYPELEANKIIEAKLKLEKYEEKDLKEYKKEQDKPVEAIAEEGE